MKAYFQGRLTTRPYTAQDGTQKYATEIQLGNAEQLYGSEAAETNVLRSQLNELKSKLDDLKTGMDKNGICDGHHAQILAMVVSQIWSLRRQMK